MRRWVAAGWLAAMSLAGVDEGAGAAALADPAPFEQIRGKLSHAQSATVTAVCGSTVAPWAYRGPRGDSLGLRAVVRAEADERWARDLARRLMVKTDWDSTGHFRGRAKLCRETLTEPLFVVCWHVANDDLYALFSFESKCARVFRVDQPLATVWLRDRADSLFAAIRGALAGDSLIAAMAMPPEAPSSTEADRSPDRFVWVEKLPNTIRTVPPTYPRTARENGWEGTVLIQALVGEDGAIHDAFVKKSVRGLDDAAVACVWDWKFEPAADRDGPIAVWVIIPIKFTLK